MPGMAGWRFIDKLNNAESVYVDESGTLELDIPANWGLILVNL